MEGKAGVRKDQKQVKGCSGITNCSLGMECLVCCGNWESSLQKQTGKDSGSKGLHVLYWVLEFALQTRWSLWRLFSRERLESGRRGAATGIVHVETGPDENSRGDPYRWVCKRWNPDRRLTRHMGERCIMDGLNMPHLSHWLHADLFLRTPLTIWGACVS